MQRHQPRLRPGLWLVRLRQPFPRSSFVSADSPALRRMDPRLFAEGPMGLAARRYCVRHKLSFTTAYHTRFPEYLAARKLLPKALTYRLLRWFHGRSEAIMVPTPAMKSALEEEGFRNVVLWGRGVDTNHFRPAVEDHACIERPLFLYVGRVAVEKNIEAFLACPYPGTKVVVVGQTNDIALYRELMRRGVSEYLTQPLSALQMIRAVGALYADPSAPFVGRQVALVGAKGGVGASTLAHNFAWAMAEKMQTATVLVDLDLAFGTAGLDFNQDPVQACSTPSASPTAWTRC